LAISLDAVPNRFVVHPRWFLDVEPRAERHDLWDVPPHIGVAPECEPDDVAIDYVKHILVGVAAASARNRRVAHDRSVSEGEGNCSSRLGGGTPEHWPRRPAPHSVANADSERYDVPARCGRIESEAAFARLAGAAPIPASSGQTIRYRLDRSGDRKLNRALHMILVTRKRSHPATIAYIERRMQEGKTRREANRCLKRYLARSLFRLLEHGAPLPT
jgi:hypothetical protein